MSVKLSERERALAWLILHDTRLRADGGASWSEADADLACLERTLACAPSTVKRALERTGEEDSGLIAAALAPRHDPVSGRAYRDLYRAGLDDAERVREAFERTKARLAAAEQRAERAEKTQDYREKQLSEVHKQLAAAEQERDEAKQSRDDAWQSADATEEARKWPPCACMLDRKDDVCALHSAAVSKAIDERDAHTATIAKLEGELMEARRGFDVARRDARDYDYLRAEMERERDALRAECDVLRAQLEQTRFDVELARVVKVALKEVLEQQQKGTTT